MATTTQKPKGLGKGLSALISENHTQPSAAAAAKAATTAKSQKTDEVAGGVYTLSITTLHAGKYQPRTQFAETALLELAESIKKNGIMQPIIVRPSPKQSGKYEIVAGERRWRAAQLANLDQIPVIIREIPDKQALELALVENIQRQDLTPLEEAQGYQRLIEEFEYTQEELSNTIGKSRSHVANLLRLLALPDEIKEMLDKGQLTMGHARALIGIPNAVEIARDIVMKGMNVRQAEQASRTATGAEKRSAPRQSSAAYKAPINKDPDILALEATLSDNLGLKVSINDRGQTGELIISYDSLSQLDNILKRLSSEGF